MVKKVKFQDLNRILEGRVTVAAYAWIYWCKKGLHNIEEIGKVGEKITQRGVW